MTVSASLTRLVHKYDLLIALRKEREACEAQGVLRLSGQAADARRTRQRQVAEEFPGCLRELENFTAQQLAERQAVIRAVSNLESETWIAWMVAFHAHLREALALKTFVSANPNAGVKEIREWVSDYPHAVHKPQHVDEKFVQAHRTPPRGSLSGWVWQQLATLFDRPVEQMRREVLGVVGDVG